MVRRTFVLMLSCAFLLGIAGITPAATQEPVAQRKAAEQAADSKIKELNKKMDEFTAEARHEGAKARDEINRLYDEFKQKQGSANKDLEELRRSTNETWDKVKVKMDKSIEELNALYERAKSKGTEKGTEQKTSK